MRTCLVPWSQFPTQKEQNMPLLHWINDDAARRAASEVPFHLLERKAVYGDPERAKDNLITISLRSKLFFLFTKAR